MHDIEQMYEMAKNTPRDIHEHIPTLRKYAEECKHITEMGVGIVRSTWAFLVSNPDKLISYDINKTPDVDIAIKLAKDNNINFIFKAESTLDVDIEPTELLFIDTYHIYDQLKAELYKHGDKSSKYIILHDTTTFGEKGENGQTPGLMKAVYEYLEDHLEWKILEEFKNCNGLLILKKV